MSLFACPAGLARADFESMEIKLDGELMDAAFKDVNGDKNPEIIVSTRKTDETGVRRRRVTIYSQKSSAGAFEPVREI
ncbi:hypothetical protein HYR69_08120, partial [Candidatus Sumerlaeota bacterium]|nr:hypothetical protein [Candidatus Sumerlaeota bacterium]